MTFLVAWRLGLLLVVGAFAGAWIAALKRRQQDAVRFTDVALIDVVAPDRSPWRRQLPAALWLLALALLIVGFARPARDVTVERESAVLVLAIDVSLSMEADDVEPTRLDAAKDAAIDFVEGLPDEVDVGLVLFSGTTTTYSPVTVDSRDALINTIRNAELSESTAIGDAISEGVSMIETYQADEDVSAEAQSGEDGEQDGEGNEGSAPPPGRIVLLGDGDNTHGESPESGASTASEAGVAVDTISFGTPDGTIVDPDGRTVSAPAAPAPLRAVADTTGGDFYEADSVDSLSAAYEDVTAEYVSTETVERDISGWFIGAGLLVLVAAGGLSLVWSQRLP